MNWKLLLDENNMNKVGHPFTTPNEFITFLAKMRSLYGIPFRSLEGIARQFSRITSMITIRGDYLGTKWHRKRRG